MNDLIEKAINLINSHDWYWMMVDFGYNESLKNAENHKNQFVKVLNSISDMQIYSILKQLWIANYNMALAFRTDSNVSDCKVEIENLSKQLNILTF